MTQSTTPQLPGVPAPMNSVWPPSNPSGTVIPFPLPWGATGCCPPGGMDALMKCYCDIQAASAFIGQILIDQINNNPAVTAAIIAAIEKSGSSLPLIGVTNGQPAQAGQVGEVLVFDQNVNYPVTQAFAQSVSLGVLPPGDWDVQIFAYSPTPALTSLNIAAAPAPVAIAGVLQAFQGITNGDAFFVLSSPVAQILNSTPQLIVVECITNQLGAGSAAGTFAQLFFARRAR